MKTPYVISVEFELVSGSAMPEFRKLIDENAQLSYWLEPGCQRFDVLIPKQDDDRILLYEIYDDRKAFEAHLKTAHYLKFDLSSSKLVQTKTVNEFSLAYVGSESDEP